MVNQVTIADTFADMAEAAAKRLKDAGMRHKSARADGEKPAEPWFRIQNKAEDSSTAQIDIYDEIDWFWGVSAADFRDQLKALGDGIQTIDLHINSPGGDVYEAIAIMNTLRQHDARVVTTVDGMAASSAGFIAVGASDELIVAENAEIMAHLPWALMIGDATEMRKMADDLDRIGKNIASIFVARAGGTLDEWMAILTDETWWSAQEAVDAGIADKVLPAPKRDAKNSARDRFNLSIFNHAGRSNAPAPRMPQAHNETPQGDEPEAEKGKEPTVALSESALQKLGLTADADEDAINEAIEKLANPAEAPELGVDEVAAVAAKLGLKLVNESEDQRMRNSLAQLEADRAERIKVENEATINAALSDGRIDKASADDWRDELAKNRESTLRLLNKLPKSHAVPVDEIGHGVGRDDQPADVEKASAFAMITGRTYGEDI